MPSSSRVDLSQRAEPSQLPEWMDEPCSYEDFRECLRDLGQVNRLTFAYRPTLAFLEAVVARKPKDTLRVIDVGAGGGDMLHQVQRWAERRGIRVELIGIDLNPHAARVARELMPASSAIQWLTGDAFSYSEPVDVVLTSLFTHHLDEPEIVRFLKWSEAAAQRGWFINDLCREATPFHLFGLLAKAMRWHRFVRHDGPVSFRRSFREEDWIRILRKADISDADVGLTRWAPGRLCVQRFK